MTILYQVHCLQHKYMESLNIRTFYIDGSMFSIEKPVKAVDKVLDNVANGSKDIFDIAIRKIPGYTKRQYTLRSRRYRNYITVLNESGVDIWTKVFKINKKLVHMNTNININILNSRQQITAVSGEECIQGLSLLERTRTDPQKIVCDSDVRIHVYVKNDDGSHRDCMYWVVPRGYSLHIFDHHLVNEPEKELKQSSGPTLWSVAEERFMDYFALPSLSQNCATRPSDHNLWPSASNIMLFLVLVVLALLLWLFTS